jgi:flagella basal body P-ring formation protein FlgA
MSAARALLVSMFLRAVAAFVLASAFVGTPARAATASVTATATEADEQARAAIVASVRDRMGRDVAVSIESLDVRRIDLVDGQAPGPVRAVPDAGSRVGGPMRFLLVDASTREAARRVGSADVVLRVSARHVRTQREVARGELISAAQVVAATDDVGRAPLQRLPVLEDVVGAAARRHLAPGAMVFRNVLDAPPLVRSGDEVTTIVRLGSVEVRGKAVSAETAAMGEVVRVVTNRRNLRGRVVAAGEVEIQR